MFGKKMIGLFAFALISVPSLINAEVSDFLILHDIDSYRFITQTKDPLTKKIIQIPGYRVRNAPGILAGASHFDIDHNDITYETDYESDITDIGVEVQVTQHAGSDSDKWLLHELDMDFRNYYGLPGRSYGPRQIEGQTILEDAAGGRNYRWMSGNKLIVIEYHDSQMTKPEPLEVVKAYLAKHPSTLPPLKLVELRGTANKTIWIKDEMERRLWLCDKWFLHVQIGKAELSDTLRTVVKYLTVFLDYRERYYGITARDEKIKLMGYLDVMDGTAIKNKLTEYKTWWSVNKTKAINLP